MFTRSVLRPVDSNYCVSSHNTGHGPDTKGTPHSKRVPPWRVDVMPTQCFVAALLDRLGTHGHILAFSYWTQLTVKNVWVYNCRGRRTRPDWTVQSEGVSRNRTWRWKREESEIQQHRSPLRPRGWHGAGTRCVLNSCLQKRRPLWCLQSVSNWTSPAVLGSPGPRPRTGTGVRASH